MGAVNRPWRVAGPFAPPGSSVTLARHAVGKRRRLSRWGRAFRAARRRRSRGSARSTRSAPVMSAASARRSAFPTVGTRARWRSSPTRSHAADRRRRVRSSASAGPARRRTIAPPANARSTTSTRSRQRRSSSSASATPDSRRRAKGRIEWPADVDAQGRGRAGVRTSCLVVEAATEKDVEEPARRAAVMVTRRGERSRRRLLRRARPRIDRLEAPRGGERRRLRPVDVALDAHRGHVALGARRVDLRIRDGAGKDRVRHGVFKCGT